MPDDHSDDWLEELIAESEAHKWQKQQVRLPHLIHAGLITPPMDLEADYTPEENNPTRKSFRLKATIRRDGSLKVNDRVYGSVSMAASMAQQPFHTKPQSQQKPEVNGWEFWSFRDPNTGVLRKIDALRDEYVTKTAKK